MLQLFVRIGAMAEVYSAQATVNLPRGRRVIVRTARGLELGEVVGPVRNGVAEEADVRVLRPTSDQDELLIRRLDKHKRRAVEACRKKLASAGSMSTLLDVDQIFDGGTLLMHFLGPVDDLAQQITGDVAKEYESIVESKKFAKLLEEGCGPDCGTKSGCSSGGCGSCALAGGCK